jgi:hypothetical protein
MMKIMKAGLAILCLVGTMGFATAPLAGAAGEISSDAFDAGSYCHVKFPAIREQSLGTRYPVLKDASEGDIIDFYGPCNHDPLGKEEVHAQLLQLQHRRAHDYMD